MSNLLSNTPRLSPERRGAEFVILWTQLVDTVGCLPSLSAQPILRSLFPHVLYKQGPSCHSLSGKNYHNCTNQNSLCLASGRWNTWLIISFCQSSSACPLSLLHTSPIPCPCIITTRSTVQGLWHLLISKRSFVKGGWWHKADRLERENSLVRPFCGLLELTTLHIPSLSLWNRAPACPAHLLWPHYAATYIQPSDEGCCSGSAILKEKKTCIPIYHHIHTHTTWTFPLLAVLL